MRQVSGDTNVAPAGEHHGQALVWNHILAITDSLVLKCAVKLHIFDIIHRHGDGHGHPISLSDLAASLPTPCLRPSAFLRFMRYLSHMRLINSYAGDEPSFSLTPSSSVFLVETSKQSLAAFITIFLDEGFLGAMHALDVACAGGGEDEASAFEMVSGETVFGRTERDPELNRIFNEGMAGSARITAAAMVEGAQAAFKGLRTVVDVGGGVGTVARAIRRGFPGISCVVLDLAHVVDGLVAADGVEYVAGDMFVSVPHADAILLMRVLHDWGDEKALDILKKCREAINDPENGKLIIVEIVVDDDEEHELHHARAASDIMMMAYGGKERTREEWRSLLLRAGFTRLNITRITALQHVIEAQI